MVVAPYRCLPLVARKNNKNRGCSMKTIGIALLLSVFFGFFPAKKIKKGGVQ